MVDREEMEKIVLREKEISLHMSRVPKKVKQEFVAFAEEEFEGDYGMLLKYLLEQTIEYQHMKKAFFNSNLFLKDTEKSTGAPNEIKMLSGRRVMKGGIKK